MERRLSEPPLVKPRIPFIREQPVSEKPVLRAECARRYERAPILYENRLDESGITEENGACTTEPETRNRPVLARGSRDELEGITSKIRQAPRQPCSAGSTVRDCLHQLPRAVRSSICGLRRSGGKARSAGRSPSLDVSQ
jgi:hypothetical protein